MDKVGIFYGPVGGSTEKVAFMIAEMLGKDNCDTYAVSKATVKDVEKYSNLIFGIATIGNETWDSEPMKSGWFTFMSDLEEAHLSGKTVALYGLGDSVRYSEHFVDAMGDLKILLDGKDVNLIGKVSAAEYTFIESKAMDDGLFAGLPVDEDFEPSLTESRISEWTDKIRGQFK